MTRRHITAHDDSGTATLWVLTWCGILLASMSAALVLGQVIALRHHVASVADSAALAAAQRPGSDDACRVASRIASAQQVDLVRCEAEPDGLTYRVTMSAQIRPIWGRQLPPIVGDARAGPAG